MKLSKISFWALSLTWGLPITLLGLITAVVLLCFGKKPYRYLYGWVFTIGDNWGGFNLGPITVACEKTHYTTLNHEFGHSIQNCYFGPLMPFLIAIPSAIRYWYYTTMIKTGKKNSSSALYLYNQIWFEKMATKFGNKYWRKLENA